MALVQILLQIMITVSPAHAAAKAALCKAELNVILTAAENKVRQTYDNKDICGKGALHGVAVGAGCTGWGLTSLKLTLSPYYYAAQKVCQKTCANEGKQKACETMITTDYMISRGIMGLETSVQKINFTPAEDGLYFEDFSSHAELINAVYTTDGAPKSAEVIGI